MSSLDGEILQGRYRITGELARGGMGIVYRGERITLGREVAIKFLQGWTAEADEARGRFEVEARAMSRLHHPNCVGVTDFGVHDGVPYLVMDLVKGQPLSYLLDDGPLPPARAAAIAGSVLAGLAHAHEQGIIHRDIKPGNVMVREVTGFADEVQILDFGVAKLAADHPNLTAGMAIGTPSYMAPEQAFGGEVNARTDLYAVGVLIHYMITGDKPFESTNKLEVLRMHRDAPRPPLPEAPPALEAVVHRAMAVDPNDRFASAAEMATALRAAMAAAAPSPALPRGAGEGAAHPRPPSPSASVPSAPSASAPPPSAPVSSPSPVRPRAPSPSRTPVPSLVPAHAPATTRTRNLWIAAAVVGFVLLVSLIAATAHRGGSSSAHHPAPDRDTADLPGLAAAVALAERDNRAGSRALEDLARAHPQHAGVHLALAHAYIERPWWPRAIETYRDALAIDPSLASNEQLIRDVLRALSSESSHPLAADFLARDVGAPALPYLEELTGSTRSPKQRARAQRVIERIRASP